MKNIADLKEGDFVQITTATLKEGKADESTTTYTGIISSVEGNKVAFSKATSVQVYPNKGKTYISGIAKHFYIDSEVIKIQTV